MPNNLNDKLDSQQVIKSVHENDENALRVKIVSGVGNDGFNVAIDAAEDSVAIGDGTKLATLTTTGGKTGLDVNLINNPLQVTVSNEVEVTNDSGNPLPVAATDLDIRNLTFSDDKIDVSGSTITLDPASLSALENITVSVSNEVEIKNDSGNPVPVSGTVTANLGTIAGVATETTLSSIDSKLTSPLSVQATDLDIRNLTFATDKIDTSGSSISVSNFPSVQPINDNGGSITVDGSVSITGTSNVNVTNSSLAVTGPLTDAELRASAVSVTAASLPLPTGASTSALQITANNSLSSIDSKLTSPLNIRNLVFATDKVDVSGSTVTLDSTSLAALENITVTVSNEVEVKNDSGNPIPTNITNTTLPISATTAILSGSAGALNADAIASTDVSAHTNLFVQITGTFSGTLTFQGSNDNINFVSVNAQTIINGTTAVGQVATTAGIWRVPINFKYFRLRMTAFVSGTATVTVLCTTSPIQDLGNRSSTVTGTVTSNQGTAAVIANSWFTKISDGVNGPAAVKAASTAPLATDPALVVSISPNSTLNANITNAQVEISNDVGNPIPVNGTVNVTQATGTNLHTVIDSGTVTATISGTPNVNITNSSIAVTGPLTDTQLRASAVPVSASSLPLPSGAATSALQTTANSSLSSIDSKLTSPLTVQATNLDIRHLTFATDKTDVSGSTVSVSNFPSVQPINDNGGSLTVDGTIAATQSGVWSVQNQDGSGNNLTSQVNGSQRALDVGINVSGVQIDPRSPLPVTFTHTSFTATNASAQALAINTSRKYLLIQNNSNQTIWLRIGAAATAAAPSIRLTSGSTFSLENNIITTQAINVIRGGATNATFTIVEGA